VYRVERANRRPVKPTAESTSAICGSRPGGVHAPASRSRSSLRERTLGGQPFGPRDYQAEAAEVFVRGGSAAGGHGVVVLPCGAGKTVVGMTVMARLQCSTLVLA